MKKFNELNKLKTASVVTLMLFTVPVTINGITLTPSVSAQDVSKTKTKSSSVLDKATQQPNSTSNSSNTSKTNSHRSGFMSGFWWFWIGRHFGASQPLTSSYFMKHGGKYNESKMTDKQKEKLNKKNGSSYIPITGSNKSKPSTTEKPKTDSNKSNENKSNKTSKRGSAIKGKSGIKSGKKAGKSNSHGGIGGHNGAHGTNHGG